MLSLVLLLPFVYGADDIDSSGLPQFLDKPLASTLSLTLLASTGASKRDLHIDLLKDGTFEKFMNGETQLPAQASADPFTVVVSLRLNQSLPDDAKLFWNTYLTPVGQDYNSRTFLSPKVYVAFRTNTSGTKNYSSTSCEQLMLTSKFDEENCKATKYGAGCRGGFFTTNNGSSVPCSAGYYCPENFLCQLPCGTGGYCAIGQKLANGLCSPYNNLPDPELGCPGASMPFPCPASYYCPDPFRRIKCPEGYFCLEGSSAPRECPLLTVCEEGTGAPTTNYAGLVFVAGALVVVSILLRLGTCWANCWKRYRRGNRDRKVHEQMLQEGLLDSNENLVAFMKSRLKAFSHKDFTMDITFDQMGLKLKKGGKSVLENVSGTFYGGRVTAIMGPSGAGKSSLLAALSGKASAYANITGKLLVNSYDTPLANFKPITGFVPQDDIMLSELTVEECLNFSAQWRLPSSLSRREMNDCVRHVLHTLQLDDVRDTIIGDGENRGVSGGQKKRVNIGMEMVADPTVLFLDEPTSGLDSTTSQVVMRALKETAQLGTAVIVVLHQPRFEIFQMFDDVMILGKGGRTIYLGPVRDVVNYFSAIGFQLPPFVNPADFLMDVCSGAVSDGSMEFHNNPTQFLVDQWEVNHAHYSGGRGPQVNDGFGRRTIPGFLWQMWLCFRRGFRQQIRSVKTELSDVLLVMLAGCVVGQMFSGSDLLRVPRVNFMIALSVSIMGVQQSLRLFGKERLVYWREAASGISRFAYFFGKTLCSLITVPLLPIAFLSLFHPFCSPRASLVEYLEVLILTQFVSQGLGHLISVLLNPDKAQLAGVVVSLVFAMVGGFSPTIPELDNMGTIGTAAYMTSYLRYVLEALFITETQNYPEVFDSQLKLLRKDLGYSNDVETSFMFCLIVLGLIGLLFHALTFFALLLVNRSKQV